MKLGHSPFLIRYNYDFQKEEDPLWKRVAKLILIWPYLKQKRAESIRKRNWKRNEIRQFDNFRQKEIIQSETYYETVSQLEANPPRADVYITGSDQVWAQLLSSHRSYPFFLCFGDKKTKRISYAPSFAMREYPEDLLGQLSMALKPFDAISVREIDGVNICKKAGYDATHVVDPTLLLKQVDYQKIIGTVGQTNPYLYIYSINIMDAEEIRWKDLSKTCVSKGLKVVVTPASGYIHGDELFGNDVTYDYASIPSWLSNIAAADMLVTTSFHGIVFALTLHCPMIYVPLKGKFASGNNRAQELLTCVGLESRIINDHTAIENYFNDSIDWEKVDHKLVEMRTLSTEFIDSALA